MRLPRKLKKKIVKCFGRSAYMGIIESILQIDKYHKNYGCIIKYNKPFVYKGSKFYMAYQRTPYLTFPKINYTND